jgi:hypothetical protein
VELKARRAELAALAAMLEAEHRSILVEGEPDARSMGMGAGRKDLHAEVSRKPVGARDQNDAHAISRNPVGLCQELAGGIGMAKSRARASS